MWMLLLGTYYEAHNPVSDTQLCPDKLPIRSESGATSPVQSFSFRYYQKVAGYDFSHLESN